MLHKVIHANVYKRAMQEITSNKHNSYYIALAAASIALFIAAGLNSPLRSTNSI